MLDKVPVANLFYLLCYAWDKLPQGRKVLHAAEKASTPLDLFAHVLLEGFNYLRKRGLDRGYQTFIEEGRRPRGRLLIPDIIKRNLLSRGEVVSSADELTYDVLHHRIIKATFSRLCKVQTLDKTLRHRLRAARSLLAEVKDIPLSASIFRRVQFHQGNQFYAFLMHVCEILFHGLLPSQLPGHIQFLDFLETRMGEMFEAFVRNFLRREQVVHDISVRRLNWVVKDASPGLQALLPVMKTDICLVNPNHQTIIECKYYKETFTHYYGAKKLRQENLFQLYGYLKAAETEFGWKACHGILLYAESSGKINEDFVTDGHPIRIVTLNLLQPWQGIHADLLALSRAAASP